MHKRVLFISMLIVTLFIASNLFGNEDSNDPCSIKLLPSSIQDTLRNKFPDWHVVTMKDLGKDDQELWKKSLNGGNCPGITLGHYEKSAYLSYAISMVPSRANITGNRLIVFSPNSKGTYKERYLEKYNGSSSPLVVYTVPPGDYQEVEEGKRITLFKEGFQWEAIEQGATLYYYQGGKYHQLLVSE
ncbi:MAG: hypothetical protein ACHQYP_05285 [Nitrospiria bacterium]